MLLLGLFEGRQVAGIEIPPIEQHKKCKQKLILVLIKKSILFNKSLFDYIQINKKFNGQVNSIDRFFRVKVASAIRRIKSK